MTIIPKFQNKYVIIKNTEEVFTNETNDSMEKQVHSN